MADTRISNLTAGTPSTTDEGVYTNGTTTLKYDFSTSRDAVLNPGTTVGQVLTVTGSGTAGFIDPDFSITYIIGGAGTTALTGTALYPPVGIGYNCTLETVELSSGTIPGVATIDLYKGVYGTPPTTSAQSIIGAGTKPVLTGGTTYQSSIAWGTATLSKGDWVAPYLGGVGTVASISLILYGRKTAVS